MPSLIVNLLASSSAFLQSWMATAANLYDEVGLEVLPLNETLFFVLISISLAQTDFRKLDEEKAKLASTLSSIINFSPAYIIE